MINAGDVSPCTEVISLCVVDSLLPCEHRIGLHALHPSCPTELERNNVQGQLKYPGGMNVMFVTLEMCMLRTG